MTAPLTHLQESTKLTGDGIVDLFEMTLIGAPTLTTVHFKDGHAATWQTKTYDSIACKISGEQANATEQQSRPTLTAMNPLGVWNSFVLKGYFEGSTLIHRRVLRQHLESNTNISAVKYWRVSRVSNVVAGQSVTLDLRSYADGPSFLIPARRYLPDAGFPFVTL